MSDPLVFTSNKAKIMLALVDLIKAQQPPELVDEEVQVREDWLQPEQAAPFRGVSVVDEGEQYDEGTCGTQDVGYLCGLVFAKKRTYDAILSDDKLMDWYERTRRRLADQRSLVTLTGQDAPAEHVCIIMPGTTLTNASKFPQYLIRKLRVAVWFRELPTT